MNIPGHQSYPNYIPYYVRVLNSERAIPAIFKRNSEQSEAKLFLIKGKRAVEKPDQAIKIAMNDFEKAFKMVSPMCLKAGEGFLLGSLILKQGYTWLGIESVIVELPQAQE